MPPLQEISINTRRGPEVTPFKRGAICNMRENGYTYRRIQQAHGVSRSTVHDTVKRFSDTNGVSKVRKGRPTVLDARMKRTILRKIHQSPKMAYSELLLEC